MPMKILIVEDEHKTGTTGNWVFPKPASWSYFPPPAIELTNA
jgi:hypothetical protein